MLYITYIFIYKIQFYIYISNTEKNTGCQIKSSVPGVSYFQVAGIAKTPKIIQAIKLLALLLDPH